VPQGLCTDHGCGSIAGCLAKSGIGFAIRYHSAHTSNPGKRISPKEAADLSRAGIDIVTVYQDRAQEPEDFGAARGLLDGLAAHAAAAAIGQPPGSAIYFAVDVDFDLAQIQSFVIPYFQGVRNGLGQAAAPGAPYEVGVYGSGLTCQLVCQSYALAKYAWLASSTGWAGSAAYTGWHLRAKLATHSICELTPTQWEACEARGSFGQFRPIGYDVTAGQGPSSWVTAAQLNVRSSPSASSQPPITQLREGQEVHVLGPATAPWLRVRASVGGSDVIGYVHGDYLSSVAPVQPAIVAHPAGSIPPVLFRPDDPSSRRDSAEKRAQPLGEPGRPSRTSGAPVSQQVTELGGIVQWLAVESSIRYRKTNVTFCNVYAADFCYLAGVYLPRTWWTASALMAIAKGQQPAVVYEQTVREMRADDLYTWLGEFGPAFGWRRVFDTTALQDAANAGGIGLVVADRLEIGRPGHITVVVPESGAYQALRDVDGNVLLPLQSQAGASNHAYSTIGRDWWNDQQFADQDGFFVHD
jgi:hypothetical protein